MSKENKGITIIALVITIIILLILAGITISITLGDNGLFSTAKRAVSNYAEAQDKESEMLANYDKEIDKILNGTNDSNNTNYGKAKTYYGCWNYGSSTTSNMPAGIYKYGKPTYYDGNLRITNEDNIILDAGYTYTIWIDCRWYNTTSDLECGLYDVKTNTLIASVVAPAAPGVWAHLGDEIKYTPTEDMVVKLAYNSASGITHLVPPSIVITTKEKEVSRINYAGGDVINGKIYPNIGTVTGELEYNSENKTVKLLEGKTYKITCNMNINVPSGGYGLFNIEGIASAKTEYWCQGDSNFGTSIIYTPSTDIDIRLMVDLQGGAGDSTIAEGTNIIISECY